MGLGLVRWVERGRIVGGYCKQSLSHCQAPPNNGQGVGFTPWRRVGCPLLSSMGGGLMAKCLKSLACLIIHIMFNGPRCCGGCDGARGGTKVVPVVVNIIGIENPGNIPKKRRVTLSTWRLPTRSKKPSGCCHLATAFRKLLLR